MRSKSVTQASHGSFRVERAAGVGDGIDPGAESVIKETLQKAFYASEDRSSSTLTVEAHSTCKAISRSQFSGIDARIMPSRRSKGSDKIV